MKTGLFSLVIFLMPFALLAAGQEDDAAGQGESLRDHALAELEADVGKWESVWTYVNADGEATGTAHGAETVYFIVEDSILQQITEVQETNNRSVSLRFYSPQDEAIKFLNVQPDGTVWEMEQEIGSGLLVSEPQIMPDGSTLQIRFTVLEKNQNYRRAMAETSRDGGKTWTIAFYQTSERVGEAGAGAN